MEKDSHLGRLLELADLVLEKLYARVEAADPMELNPQAMKHITGVMKDLKDIRAGTHDNAGHITVVFLGEGEQYSA
jgi:hypothetical protein